MSGLIITSPSESMWVIPFSFLCIDLGEDSLPFARRVSLSMSFAFANASSLSCSREIALARTALGLNVELVSSIIICFHTQKCMTEMPGRCQLKHTSLQQGLHTKNVLKDRVRAVSRRCTGYPWFG